MGRGVIYECFTGSGAMVVNALVGTAGFTKNAGTGYGYITVANLQAAAKASLLANPNTTASGVVRTYQESMKILLDQLNNNGNNGYNVPLTVVSNVPCTF